MIKNLDLRENLIFCHTIGLKGTDKNSAADVFHGWRNTLENIFEEYSNVINLFNTNYDFFGIKSEVLWPNIPATEERINEILDCLKDIKPNE